MAAGKYLKRKNIHVTAFVSRGADIAPTAYIGAGVVMDAESSVGDDVSIGAGVTLEGSRVLDAAVSESVHLVNSVVRDGAKVRGHARVQESFVADYAIVGGRSVVRGVSLAGKVHIRGHGAIYARGDWIVLGPALSSSRWTTAHVDSGIGVRVNTGCFSGSLRDFIDQINETHHARSKARAQYMLFVELIRSHFGEKLCSGDMAAIKRRIRRSQEDNPR